MDAADFRRGLRDVAPLLLGVAPFGVVAGIAAADAGLGLAQAVGMSVVVFAGAAQLAAIELLGADAPVAVVVVTAVVINLRLLMYSASIAPYFRAFATRWKAALAYVLTDQAYALSVSVYRGDGTVDRRAYYLGAALALWAVWQATTVAGVVVGTGLPEAWGLEFAVPLVFLALLVPAMEDRTTTLAAVAGGSVAVAAGGLPLNLGLLVGAAAGIGAGLAGERVLEDGDDD
jgi:4-azaleucine resistance transporter AzlC